MGHKGNKASLTVVLAGLALTFLPPKQNFIWNFLCQGQIRFYFITIFSNYKTTENIFK